MPAYFFDTSALVKFYVEESGAAWVRSFTDAESNIIHVSSLAEVETVSALTTVEASVQVVRAFVRLRQMLSSNAELARKLSEIERKYDSQFKVVFDAIRQLMTSPEPPRKQIGFAETTKK